MQFYGISVMRPYKRCDQGQDVFDQTCPDINQTAYMDAQKKYHKSLPEDEYLNDQNMSKTLQLN
jgi:hypothetical protein